MTVFKEKQKKTYKLITYEKRKASIYRLSRGTSCLQDLFSVQNAVVVYKVENTQFVFAHK